ncbi:MAG: hypothetical protein N2036_10725 [Bryobacteraceae bacterium]|nr:hypothetical protein [Bryobacteraceae bacterium]
MPPCGGFPRLPRAAAYAAFSALLLLPVLLPRHVPAADLPSHLYNTWLAMLVREGRAPGVELVLQWSNVLFDWWLEALWRLGGPALAEKGAVAAAVLVFFWGAFALASAIQQRPAWVSAPVLAMLAYGWTYHMGFFNYYLSCGFGFWVLACVWRQPVRWAPAGAALVLSGLAHPLGAAAAAGLAAFLLVLRKTARERLPLLVAAAVAGLAGFSFLLQRLLPCRWEIQNGLAVALFGLQFRPFGAKYGIFLLAIPMIWLAMLGWRALGRWENLRQDLAFWLACTVAAAIVLLPQSVQLPGTAWPLHFIGIRIAMFLAVFLEASVSSGPPGAHRAARGAFFLLTVAYFGFLAHDYRAWIRTQDEFVRAEQQVPPGSRVVSTVSGLPLSLNPLNHMVSKACIGRCFSYGSYAPSSRQFRVRSKPLSPVVLDDSLDVDRLQAGRFVVRPRDVPLFGIFLVSAEPFRLEARPLKAGETIPRQGVRIPPDWF